MTRHFGRTSVVATLVFAALTAVQPARADSPPVDMGTLGGSSSSGYRVNSHGAVIGYSTLAGDMTSQAFLYNSAGMQALSLGGSYSVASDINSNGQIVGASY